MSEHTAPGHDLPVSNGYGQTSGQPPTVYCARCRGEFTVDRAWVDRYFATRRRRIDADLARGHLTPGQHLDAMAYTDQDEAAVLASLKERAA